MARRPVQSAREHVEFELGQSAEAAMHEDGVEYLRMRADFRRQEEYEQEMDRIMREMDMEMARLNEERAETKFEWAVDDVGFELVANQTIRPETEARLERCIAELEKATIRRVLVGDGDKRRFEREVDEAFDELTYDPPKITLIILGDWHPPSADDGIDLFMRSVRRAFGARAKALFATDAGDCVDPFLTDLSDDESVDIDPCDICEPDDAGYEISDDDDDDEERALEDFRRDVDEFNY